MLNHDLVLKSDELFLVGAMHTDGSGEQANGLYVRDTRHLNYLKILLNGTPLRHLSARTISSSESVLTSTNELIVTGHEQILPQTISVRQHFKLATHLSLSITVANHAGRSLPIELSLECGADFRDLFDIRGFPRGARGEVLPPELVSAGVLLAYHGLDDLRAATEIRFDRPAAIAVLDPDERGQITAPAVLLPGFDRVSPGVVSKQPIIRATFSTIIPVSDEWTVIASIAPCPANGIPISGKAILGNGAPPEQALIQTDVPFLNQLLDRSRVDLGTLQTTFSEGSLPAAGVPWYVAPFGRDSLIVGLQTLHVAPHRAASTLRLLGALQGTKHDPDRDEEPGKILHEVRHGEMARNHEIPHTPYFGTIDATPLFLMLLAETARWLDDARLFTDLRPHAERAIRWIQEYGDTDGDGLVEYQTAGRRGAGVSQKGWKDSYDSLHHPDGTSATGNIALVEVQGYVYAAYARLAETAAFFGDPTWAATLRENAKEIRALIEERFWMEEEGFYAQALDNEKRQVQAISSNPGHLLYCRVPSPERAQALATRFDAPDINSGWGIRTLSSQMPNYNPMSYHNGSVWPHDNSLIAAGLSAYGHHEIANRITTALLEASVSMPLVRLPELYCGFAREGTSSDAPVPYPVSCSPQAWASAAAPLLIWAMLGLEVDLTRRRLTINPSFPAWLSTITLGGIEVMGETCAVSVSRSDDGYTLETNGPIEWRQMD
ncbi:MAG: amylo-alpha-1,6-glucosidase [Chloroflexota bacterium]|nr:amylo-alpha-1,6-glucosidase [Chloroflexota bacterium]